MRKFDRQRKPLSTQYSVLGTAPAGFTLVELLVVIGIIMFLVAISVTVVANFVSRAKEAATAATIRKIDGLVAERKEALDRAFDTQEFTDYVQRVEDDLKKKDILFLYVARTPKVFDVLVRKWTFRQSFPQRFAELSDANSNGIPDVIENDPEVQYDPTSHQPKTESAELLYYVLTHGNVFGVASVSADEFRTSEVKDTDGDGLPEFVDAWERPLRFYRWPTRLLKPWGAGGKDGQPGQAGVDDNRNGVPDDPGEIGTLGTDDAVQNWIRTEVAGLLIQGLPAQPIGSKAKGTPVDPLSQDPDDPAGLLTALMGDIYVQFKGSRDLRQVVNETQFPTLNTYHTPLIVSAGPDGELGLYEPFELDAPNDIYGVLAQPGDSRGTTDPSDDLRIGKGSPREIMDRLSDNITNRNVRAGGI